jgi:hypothetical protein
MMVFNTTIFDMADSISPGFGIGLKILCLVLIGFGFAYGMMWLFRPCM